MPPAAKLLSPVACAALPKALLLAPVACAALPTAVDPADAVVPICTGLPWSSNRGWLYSS
ncbi:hypothetical protein D3C73_991770 [compost metagenome]